MLSVPSLGKSLPLFPNHQDRERSEISPMMMKKINKNLTGVLIYFSQSPFKDVTIFPTETKIKKALDAVKLHVLNV